MHQLVKLTDDMTFFTTGNPFPSHSCIGWPESNPYQDLNLGLRGRRLVNWAMPPPSKNTCIAPTVQFTFHIYKYSIEESMCILCWISRNVIGMVYGDILYTMYCAKYVYFIQRLQAYNEGSNMLCMYLWKVITVCPLMWFACYSAKSILLPSTTHN